MAKTAIGIYATRDFRVTGFHNGLSYGFENIKTGKEIFFQGESAVDFREQIDAWERIDPERDTNDILRDIWSEYCLLLEHGAI